jgi:hypothetical protein
MRTQCLLSNLRRDLNNDIIIKRHSLLYTSPTFQSVCYLNSAEDGASFSGSDNITSFTITCERTENHLAYFCSSDSHQHSRHHNTAPGHTVGNLFSG